MTPPVPPSVTPSVTLPVTPLSVALRQGTRDAHERAENAAFVGELLAGAHPVGAYAALAAQHHAIYSALEAVADGWAGHEVGRAFVLPELVRLPALESDLAALLGRDWHRTAASLVQPATVRYVEHLLAVAGGSMPAFVAHHYVRYLGDLSGGQVVGRRVAELYGAAGEAARAFYTFALIPHVPPFRDSYRARLDALVLTAAERELLLAEAVLAFELNHAVFADLAAAHHR